MYMSLGRLLFERKRLLNTIVIIQLGIALAIGNLLIGNFDRAYASREFTEIFDDRTAFFTTLKHPYGEDATEIDYALLDSEGASLEPFVRKVEGSKTQIFAYGEKTARILIDSQLKEGEWQDPATVGTIDCAIIGGGYRLGETFSQSVGDKSLVFRVVASLGSSATVINTSRASSSMTADRLFYEYNANKSGTAIICLSEPFAAAGTYENGMVFNLTDGAEEYLNSIGKVFDMARLCENSREELTHSSGLLLPLFIFFCLMGLVSAVCMEFMNILANKGIFTVYFRVGMTRRDAFLINLGYMTWIIIGVIAAATVIFLLGWLSEIIDRDAFSLGIGNLLFSLGYLLTTAAGTSLVSLAVLRKIKEDV